MEAFVVCRTCLRKTKKFVSIFSAPELWGKNIVIAKLIMACAPVVIKIGDGLPSKICHHCLELLQLSFLFRLRVITANENFKEIIQTQVLQEGQVTRSQTTNLNHIYSAGYIAESILNNNSRIYESVKQEPLDIKEEPRDISESTPGAGISSKSPSTTVTENPIVRIEKNILLKPPQNHEKHNKTLETSQKHKEHAETVSNSKNNDKHAENRTKVPEKSLNNGKHTKALENPEKVTKAPESAEIQEKEARRSKRLRTHPKNSKRPEISRHPEKHTNTPENPQNYGKHAETPKITKTQEHPAKVPDISQNKEISPKIQVNPPEQVKAAKIPDKPENHTNNNNKTILTEQPPKSTQTLPEKIQEPPLNKRKIAKRSIAPAESCVSSNEKKRCTNYSNKNNGVLNQSGENNTPNSGESSDLNKEKVAKHSSLYKEIDRSSIMKELRIKRTYSKIDIASSNMCKFPKYQKEVLITLPKDYNSVVNSKQQDTGDVKPVIVTNLQIGSNECIVIDDD